ncbi:hypothetical protein ACX0G7_11370 [Flavitalea antarctica]
MKNIPIDGFGRIGAAAFTVLMEWEFTNQMVRQMLATFSMIDH